MTQQSDGTPATGREPATGTEPSTGRPADSTPAVPPPADFGRVSVVGAGRLGSVLVSALKRAGVTVSGPHGRGYQGSPNGLPDSIVVLCVPDAAIAAAATMIATGPLVVHCSGATSLAVLGSHRGFSMHPVMTFTEADDSSALDGVAAAIAATDPAAGVIAHALALRLGLRPFDVADSDRTAYHAATAIAANFLVTLEAAAATVLATAGLDRGLLVPLARTALENWGRLGPAALTGPVARGDVGTVRAHRAVIAERTPDLLPLFDAMAAATAALAGGRPASAENLSPARTSR